MRMKSDVRKSDGRNQEDQRRSYQIEILIRDTGRMEAKVADLDREHMQTSEKMKGYLSREATDFARRSGNGSEER